MPCYNANRCPNKTFLWILFLTSFASIALLLRNFLYTFFLSLEYSFLFYRVLRVSRAISAKCSGRSKLSRRSWRQTLKAFCHEKIIFVRLQDFIYNLYFLVSFAFFSFCVLVLIRSSLMSMCVKNK